jgi:hypothetical protein
MKKVAVYALKVWLTAIVAGAFLLNLISFINARAGDLSVIKEYLYFFGIFIAEALVFSFPILLMLLIITGPVTKRKWSSLQKKLYLALITLVGYSLIFCIIFRNAMFNHDTLMIWPPYAIGIALSFWGYRLPAIRSQGIGG